MPTSSQLVTLTLDQSPSGADSSPAPGELRTSSYCIFVKLPKHPEQVLLVHGYTGAYDEVSVDVAEYLYARRAVSKPLYGTWTAEFDGSSGGEGLDEETIAELENRGYLTNLSIEEERERLRSVAGLVHSFEMQSVNYILVPGYDCNLRCPYCFQDYMRTDPAFGHLLRRMTPEIVDRILDGIVDLEAGMPEQAQGHRQFTLFGGEPLLAGNFEIIEYILKRASALGPCTFGAITNGTDLDRYSSLLGPDGISSLQITLDGPPRAHDLFRIYADGQGSFEKIASNLKMALDRGVGISVRVNVCRDNIGDLPALALEAERRGWTSYKNFQIYVAPIQPAARFPDNGRLFNSHQLGQALRKLQEEDPLMKIVGTADDSMKDRALQLFREPEIDPVADFKASFCGAHSGMYIFDPFGDIYACWERMGDPGIRIGRVGEAGTFLFETPMLSKWRGRTVATNPTCERCSYSLHCGGGCAVLAESQNGEYFSNHCDGFGARFRHAVADAYETYLNEQEGAPHTEQIPEADAFRMKPGCL
jgi:uncharacterized protein